MPLRTTDTFPGRDFVLSTFLSLRISIARHLPEHHRPRQGPASPISEFGPPGGMASNPPRSVPLAPAWPCQSCCRRPPRQPRSGRGISHVRLVENSPPTGLVVSPCLFLALLSASFPLPSRNTHEDAPQQTPVADFPAESVTTVTAPRPHPPQRPASPVDGRSLLDAWIPDCQPGGCEATAGAVWRGAVLVVRPSRPVRVGDFAICELSGPTCQSW